MVDRSLLVPGAWFHHMPGTQFGLGWGKILAVEEAGLVAMRFRRDIRWLIGSLVYMTPLDREIDDMNNPFEARRAWFDLHPKVCHGRISCPCCGYPTAICPPDYVLCPVCDWSDNEQDDLMAQEVTGENNQYSLALSRQNFGEHGHMYLPTDTRNVDRLEVNQNVRRMRAELRSRYDGLRETAEPQDIAQLWAEIDMFMQQISKQ